MYTMIATWTMARDGLNKGKEILEKKGSCEEALITAIKDVEDNPYFKSVGYGGLPNKDMVVELDAGYMDGNTLAFGALGALQDYESPIQIANSLSKESVNNVLVGQGVALYAKEKGFKEKKMLSDRAKIYYHNRQKQDLKKLKPYAGHDTVGVVALDSDHSMCAGTSTSGLFMKRAGRIGDSPIIGAGLYCDSAYGGATATGLGEDLMKGCISYEIVRKMKDGKSSQEACDQTVQELNDYLILKRGEAGDLSVVALNNKGEWGAASNIDTFSFVVTNEEGTTVYTTRMVDGKSIHTKASEEFLEEYYATRMAKLKEED